jgi:hypothetical protein
MTFPKSQHVEPAERADGSADCSAYVVGVGDVEVDDRQAVGVRGGKVVERRGRAGTGDHAVSGVQGSLGDDTPKSTRGAGYEEDV